MDGRRKEGNVDEWRHGWMHGRMDGHVEGWMDEE